jgi:hypothetical protein
MPVDGERMLLWCQGGPSTSRLVRYPPPLEIEEREGCYVLVDDGPPETWHYDFVPTSGTARWADDPRRPG